MWGAAVLVLLTLIAPPIASVVCDLTCVQHQHQLAQAIPVRDCHQHQSSNDELAVTSGPAAPCHDHAESFTATAAQDCRVLKAASVAAQRPPAAAAYRPGVPGLAPGRSFGPLRIILQTTPLRV